MKTYDYLVVGSGLFGSVFAHEMAKKGYRIHIIEKREHIGGNIYTKEAHGIQVHQYGAHIFHTNDQKIWNYINQFATFNRFTNAPIANYKGKIFNLPFNMNTFYQLWGTITPQEAEQRIAKQREQFGPKGEPQNLEEQAISLVGMDIYRYLVKEYTEKQWGKDCKDLPSFIIKRLPVRLTYDNNYFNDRYQGIPEGGYTQIIEKMLDHPNITVDTNCDFFDQQDMYLEHYPKVVFTGMIDQFFHYEFGELEYRSLAFETEYLPDNNNYQGNAVVNYTDKDTPYTRIIEHKHFEFATQEGTIITKEFPKTYQKGDEPYYPINDERNNMLYQKYKDKAAMYPNVIFGGRLGSYQYYDMHKVIESALNCVTEETCKK